MSDSPPALNFLLLELKLRSTQSVEMGVAGIVEHACLLGTPVAVRPERWAMARSVVAGRLINGYSRKDWLLAIVYRGSNGFIKDAAGLGPIAMSGIENVNLTGLIQGHFEYIDKVAEILDLIGLYS